MTRRGFDYMTVDAVHRRVYAAHPSSASVLVVDADTGKLLPPIHVGAVHGVAVDEAADRLYTGDGIDQRVSEVDAQTGTVLRNLDVPGPVDAVAVDPVLHRLYADEADGSRLFVIDTQRMALISILTLPGHDLEYLAIDPQTHTIYQNIPHLGEFVSIDAMSQRVVRTVSTNFSNNHPLQFDTVTHHIISGGDGQIAVYSREGQMLAESPTQKRVDQCDLDQRTGYLACAGIGEIRVYATRSGATLGLIGQIAVPAGVHTTAIDPVTGRIWAVWAGPTGEFVQAFHLQP